MVAITIILLMLLTVFLLNANPIFTLPTWTMVALFMGDLTLTGTLPFLVIAVVASTLGRYVLTLYSEPLVKNILSKKQKKSVELAKGIFDGNYNEKKSFLIAFIYSVLPLPSNTLFIVAGAARLRLPGLLAGFMAGEIISSALYLSTLGVVLSLGESLAANLVIGALGFAVAIIFFMVDWERILGRTIKTRSR